MVSAASVLVLISERYNIKAILRKQHRTSQQQYRRQNQRSFHIDPPSIKLIRRFVTCEAEY
jgi:hypothetical protein